MILLHPQFVFIVIIPLLISLFTLGLNYRYLSRELKAFYLLMAVYLASDILLGYINLNWRSNTIWIVNIMTVFRLCVVMFIFYQWADNERTKNLIKGSVFFLVSFWIIAKITFEPITAYHKVTGSMTYAVIVMFCIYFISRPLNNQSLHFFRNSQFWILVSLTIYCIPSMAIAAFQGALDDNIDAILAIYYAKWLFTGVSYASIGWAAACERTVIEGAR